ncbi:hypothetical protein D9757_008428 [Collybiopsis confluens]|uniref:Uncharacterized protein n=1 Tax=Collybiopsis confluens TaxID=2823264 RepID=A0A8H5HH52_9AGAR|nr:hypothetical protein D9757_008428 [Collybiopsis confluens]
MGFEIEDLPLTGGTLEDRILALKIPVRGPVSTTKNAVTRPSDTTNGHARTHLRRLYWGKNFIDRLLLYTDSKRPNVLPNVFRAADCPNKSPLPSFASIMPVLSQISNQEANQARAKEHEAFLTSNASVGDEVSNKITSLINLYLRTRHQNTSSVTPRIPQDTAAIRASFKDSSGNNLPNHNVFSPLWLRPAPALHKEIANTRNSKSGLTDWCLVAYPDGRPRSQVASIQAFDFWNYSTPDMKFIYSGHPSIIDKRNFFRGSRFGVFNDAVANKLLRQLSASIHALQCPIGFFTNMEVGFFYMPYNGEDADNIIARAPAKLGDRIPRLGVERLADKNGKGANITDRDGSASESDQDSDDPDDDPGTDEDSEQRLNTNEESEQIEAVHDRARSVKVKFDIEPERGGRQSLRDQKEHGEEDKPILYQERGLILSSLIGYDDPDLLRCIQAMSYIGIDSLKWTATGELEGQEQPLVSMLTPVDELVLITNGYNM